MSVLLCSSEILGSSALFYGLSALLVVLIGIGAFVAPTHPPVHHTKAIVYASIMIALSFGLSYVKLFSLPSGGSVTLASMLPVMVYSCLFGTKRGVLVGILCGILNFIQAPWLVHWTQFLLDYPIAFGAMGLSGVFFKDFKEKKKILRLVAGTLLAVTLRYFSHVLSGIFVWGSGDPENYGAVAWSFLYNSFVFVDCAIALVAGCGLFASKQVVSFMQKAVR